MTVDYLKELFIEKYGNGLFTSGSPEVMVTLTNQQYSELNQDLLKKTKDPILLMIEEEDLKNFNPELMYWTRIIIPKLCQFIVQLGDKFDFRLFDVTEEYGDEDL